MMIKSLTVFDPKKVFTEVIQWTRTTQYCGETIFNPTHVGPVGMGGGVLETT